MQAKKIDPKDVSGKAPSERPKRGPRERLLSAGKTLFAESGFESTSTSSIASLAGTSESQLVRYFGGKAGLLQEIFNMGWIHLNRVIGSKVVSSPTGREAILNVLETLTSEFHEDEDLAAIFLFEGRRIRGREHEVFFAEGFVRFRELIHKLIERGIADGSFKKELPSPALVSAMIGCAEGMIRDGLVARRLGNYEDFAPGDIRRVSEALLSGL